MLLFSFQLFLFSFVSLNSINANSSLNWYSSRDYFIQSSYLIGIFSYCFVSSFYPMSSSFLPSLNYCSCLILNKYMFVFFSLTVIVSSSNDFQKVFVIFILFVVQNSYHSCSISLHCILSVFSDTTSTSAFVCSYYWVSTSHHSYVRIC